MSQAEALLNSLSSNETTVYSRNAETEGRIVIGNDRRITVPDSLKRIAVQYDHNVETVTFDCPRYWDNYDMSQMKVYINYLLPDNRIGYYPAENITPVGNTMTFTWTIKNEITQVKGNISILVCVKSTDANGYESAHWNSELNSEMYVSEGLEATQQIISQYPDIVTFLLTRMDEVEAIATVEAMQSYTNEWLEANHERILAEIEAKGLETLATIPADYTDTYRLAHDSVRTRANAIVCSSEGEPVLVNDSSDDYLRGLHIYGMTTQVKTIGAQLLNVPDQDSKTDRGLTQVTKGGACTVHGVANSTAAFNLTLVGSYNSTNTIFTLPPGTYTATDCIVSSYDGSTRKSYSNAFELAETLNVTWVSTRSYRVSESVSETTYPMLNEGSTALPWEPYSGGVASPNPEWQQPLTSVDSPTVSVYGANFADISSIEVGANTSVKVSDDQYAIEVTGGADKVYTSSPIQLPMELLKGKTVILRADRITNSMDSSGQGGNVQLNIRDSVKMKYVAISPNNLTAVTTIPEDVSRLDLNIYSNNSNTLFASENTTTVYGLSLSIVDVPWDTFKDPQTFSVERTLRGIPVTAGGNYTDSDGQQWICDEIDFVRGVYIQRVGQFILGNDRTYYYNTDTVGKEFFYTANNNNVAAWEKRMYCSHFPVIGNEVGMESDYWTQFSGSGGIRFRHKDLTSLSSLAAWLDTNNVEVVYPLATPIETPLTADELKAFAELRSNYPTTTILNDSGAWVKMEYNADTRTYIENLPGASEEDVSNAVNDYLTKNPVSLDPVVLTDTVTGVKYRLYVANGKLTMSEV